MPMPEDPFELSARFVDEIVSLSPIAATNLGVAGFDDRWDDFSPEGRQVAAGAWRRHVRAMERHLDHPDARRRLCARVESSWLRERLAEHEAGDHLRRLSHTSSPFEEIRDVFDIMDTSTSAGWEAVCRRLETVGDPLGGYRDSLEEGRRRGLVAAARQVRSVILQARRLAGPESGWGQLQARADRAGFDAVGRRLESAIRAGRREAGRFADYLESEYLPVASPHDGVGREHYVRAAAAFLGSSIDPEATYEWGWEEITRLWSEMRRVVQSLVPGGSVHEVRAGLESGEDALTPVEFVSFIERRQQRAVEELDGRHFDVPPEIRRVTVSLAPPGGALGAYYVAPSEDLTRPGSIWYSLGDKERIPLYQEVSTAYHEGFPGHHLQIGTARTAALDLGRFHRTFVWYPGYGEGWALYAERLMEELGYYERPEYAFGMLASQVFRATRIVVDIGLHLHLPIPETVEFEPGGRWDHPTAVRALVDLGLQPRDYADSEVIRYLGWPGQAISYKVGERALLALRSRLRRRLGAAYDLRAFHRAALARGGMGLDLLAEVVVDEDEDWETWA